MHIANPHLGKHSVILSAVILTVAGFGVPCSAQIQTYSERVLADNPFAYWRLEETEGTTATNLGTSTAESANYAGPLELGVAGLVRDVPEGLADSDDKAVRFLGFDDVDTLLGGKVDIADSNLTNAGGPYVEKTIEMWFSVDDADTFDEQILYEQGGSTRGMAMYVREGQVFVGAHNSADDDGSVATPWVGGAGGDRELAFVSADIDSNTAYHLALVMDGDADGFEGKIIGYLDGKPFGEVPGIGILFGHTDDSAIGGLRSETLFDNGLLGSAEFNYFQGVIDEVALYDRALPAGRIAIHVGGEPSADINSDGMVDLSDFAILSSHFNGPGAFEDGDINFDEVVNMTDFVQWRNAFQAEGVAAAAVPEPMTGVLVLFGLLALPLMRRHLVA